MSLPNTNKIPTHNNNSVKKYTISTFFATVVQLLKLKLTFLAKLLCEPLMHIEVLFADSGPLPSQHLLKVMPRNWGRNNLVHKQKFTVQNGQANGLVRLNGQANE